MPYAKIDDSTLKSLMLNFKNFYKDTCEPVLKDKKQKAKAKELEKELKAKSQNIGKVLDKMMGEALDLYNKHALDIEGLLTTTAKALSDLKKASADSKKSGKADGDAMIQAAKLARSLEPLGQQAKNLSGEFAVAWLAVRTGNYTDIDGFDASVVKSFGTNRNKIIVDLKGIDTKITKIELAAKEAKILADDLKMPFGTGEVDSASVAEDVEDLEKRINKEVTAIEKNIKAANGFLGQIKTWATTKPENAVTTAEGLTAEQLKFIKNGLSSAKVLGKELEQLKGVGKGSGEDADEALEKAETALAEMNSLLKNNAEIYKNMALGTEALRPKKKK